MRISELANLSGCTVETIRFYEAKGILPKPARTSSNYRIYNDKHLEQVTFIRHCRALDISLEEIRLLVSQLYSPKSEELSKAHNIIENHLTAIDQKIEELLKLKLQLEKLHAHCHHDDHENGKCAVIEGLKQPE